MNIISTAVIRLLDLLELALLIRVLLSWFPISRDNQLIRLLYQITEPILSPIRGLIQKSALAKNMQMDFSPLVAFLLIGIIKTILAKLLYVRPLL